jgi:menaquinone-9 beta-reductase
MQMNYDFDVVVCGAGPAGAAASLFLSEKGVRHLVIDQSVFPRTKVCGDGITPVCLTILEQVIPGIKEKFMSHQKVKKINRLRLYSLNGKFADLDTKDYVPEHKNHLFTVSRYAFDHYLTEALQQKPEATFWQNTKLLDYDLKADGVLLKLQTNGETKNILCKIAIAADGDRSIFRKRIIRTAIDRSQMVAAIRTYYKNVTPVAQNDQYEVFALEEVLPGYFWIFPMSDGSFNVGLGITSDVIQQKKINLRKLMNELLTTHPLLKDRFANAEMLHAIEGSGLPIMLEKEPQLSDERILLTGDAGALADPITGEGIGPGLISGKYAAVIASEALIMNDFSAAFLHKYDEILHQKITRPYELRIKLFDWFIKQPYRINWLIWAAPKLGWIRNFFANSVNGKFEYRDITNPKKWGKIFGGYPR